MNKARTFLRSLSSFVLLPRLFGKPMLSKEKWDAAGLSFYEDVDDLRAGIDREKGKLPPAQWAAEIRRHQSLNFAYHSVVLGLSEHNSHLAESDTLPTRQKSKRQQQPISVRLLWWGQLTPLYPLKPGKVCHRYFAGHSRQARKNGMILGIGWINE